MASPGETAKAVLQLYREPALRERMRDTMRERVRRFYDQRDMVSAYDEIYTRWIGRAPHEEPEAPEEKPAAAAGATARRSTCTCT